MMIACRVPAFRHRRTVLTEFFDGGEGLITCDARKPTGDALSARRTIADREPVRPGRDGGDDGALRETP
jgi:hypothetical protein